MNWKKILIGGGLAAAAPFTGGTSLGWLPAALGATGVGTAIGGALEKGQPKAAATATPTGSAGLPVPGGTELKDAAGDASARGKALGDTGDAALKQVVDYYSKLMGGDADAIAQATAPERARVIDQYDTARDAITKFSPRGGGTNSASAYSRIAEANELSDVTASARQGAPGALAQIGTTEQGLGLQASGQGSSDLNASIQNALAARGLDINEKGLDLTKRGQNLSTLSGFGEALGSILGLILTRGKKAA